MKTAIHFYSLLLRFYPKSYRQAFEDQMVQTFSDQYEDITSDSGEVGLSFWIHTLKDEISNILKQQIISLRGGEFPMKKYSFGLAISFFMIIAIVLTNVVFPSYGTDDYPAVGFMYFLYFISFAVTGYLAVGKKDNVLTGTKSGAIMGFVVMMLMIATYFVIDNVFIDIVSKQTEKIAYFREGGFSTMRDLINFGLLKGLVFGSIMGSVFGALFGTIGGGIKKYKLAK